MKRNLLFAFGLMCLFLCAQCTVQKRIYRKGWYISFKKEWRNPGNDQSQEFVSDNERKTEVDVATVSDVSPEEDPQPETVSDDSSPKNNSATEELKLRVRNVSPAFENEDTINEIAADPEQLASQPSKASIRPVWVKQLAIFLFFVAIIVMVAAYFLTSPMEITASLAFGGVLFLIALLVFLITLVLVSSSKKKPTLKPEKKRRLMTLDEQAEKKKERKREAIILTIALSAILLLLLGYAFYIETFVFLLPVGIAFALFIMVAWFEYRRKRSSEMIEDVVIPEKIYRQKTETEKQAELKKHKRKSLISVIFWAVVLIFTILVSIPFESAVFFWVMTAICLTFAFVSCFEYFRWKPKETVEIEQVPDPEKEAVIETPIPDKEELATQKPSKTREEQRKLNLKRNVAVGLFFATLITFFIFASNK